MLGLNQTLSINVTQVAIMLAGANGVSAGSSTRATIMPSLPLLAAPQFIVF